MLLLLLASFLFFRPDFVIDRIAPKYVEAPAARLFEVAGQRDDDEWVVAKVAGENVEGREIAKTIALPLGKGKDGREKLRAGGTTLVQLGSELQVADVKFGSRARKLGVEQGYKVQAILLENPQRPSDLWVFLPAGLVAAAIWFLQGLRLRSAPSATPA